MTGIVPTLISRRRVKLVRQSESAECGLAALAMILNYWGARTDLAALRRRFGISSRGVGLGDLMAFADRLGMTSRPLRIELDDLASLSLPAILHWNLEAVMNLWRVRRPASS